MREGPRSAAGHHQPQGATGQPGGERAQLGRRRGRGPGHLPRVEVPGPGDHLLVGHVGPHEDDLGTGWQRWSPLAGTGCPPVATATTTSDCRTARSYHSSVAPRPSGAVSRTWSWSRSIRSSPARRSHPRPTTSCHRCSPLPGRPLRPRRPARPRGGRRRPRPPAPAAGPGPGGWPAGRRARPPATRVTAGARRSAASKRVGRRSGAGPSHGAPGPSRCAAGR